MDLIMGHAGQTLEDWTKELCFAMDVVDDHISLYHLTVEPGTEYISISSIQGEQRVPSCDVY
jgi:coproporphyrinogen III oxidase-like Fe-S oxidoreductase